MSYADELERIEQALDRAREILSRFSPGNTSARFKKPGDPVTEADLEIDRVLRATLPGPGDAWLSEESADDPARLAHERERARPVGPAVERPTSPTMV